MDSRRIVGQQRGGHKQKTPLKPEPTGFAAFGLRPELLQAAEKMGWTTPTPVQLEAIPPAMDGHDLIALAQTGTGKTGAYLLPILQALSAERPARPNHPYCVIIAPTRELVQQIETQASELGNRLKLRSMTIFGGVSERPQIARLKTGVEIVAATPGRLLDLIGQGVVNFDRLTHCILDESDRMFDMGFIQDLKRILSYMPPRRQTLLFSATMPPEIQRLTEDFLHNPREVRLSINLPPPELRHEVWELKPSQNAALETLLLEDHDSVLVFTRTKHRADSVAKRLARGGEAVAVLHGNRSQNQRNQALARFKQGDARVLVATDVASRGLDIVGIGLVINFDTPRDPDDYIHRVGRTARAKRKGCAISFVVADETKYIRKIEQLLKQPIERRQQDLPASEVSLAAIADNRRDSATASGSRPRKSERQESSGTARRSQTVTKRNSVSASRRRHKPRDAASADSIQEADGQPAKSRSGLRPPAPQHKRKGRVPKRPASRSNSRRRK